MSRQVIEKRRSIKKIPNVLSSNLNEILTAFVLILHEFPLILKMSKGFSLISLLTKYSERSKRGFGRVRECCLFGKFKKA